MKKKRAKKIATWIIVPFMAAIFILDIITVELCNYYCKRYPVSTQAVETAGDGDDRIHFLNTANSDAILIESNGMFALVDSGEGDSNPRRKLEYEGYEQEVVDYIIKTVGKGGKAQLEFVMGTHCHYDHIGAYHAIITNENIDIKKAYFKGYDKRIGKDYETEKWMLGEIYAQIEQDIHARGIELVNALPSEPFDFGDFTLQFYNTVNNEALYGKGENAASVGVKVTKDGLSAFLAADITASTGLEDLLADKIGDVDLLKIGHHGYYGSSSMSFLDVLKPEIAVVTNQLGKIYPNVKWNLTMSAKCPIYATYDNNGLIALFSDSGEISLFGNIH